MITSETFVAQCAAHTKLPMKINRSKLEYLIGLVYL